MTHTPSLPPRRLRTWRDSCTTCERAWSPARRPGWSSRPRCSTSSTTRPATPPSGKSRDRGLYAQGRRACMSLTLRELHDATPPAAKCVVAASRCVVRHRRATAALLRHIRPHLCCPPPPSPRMMLLVPLFRFGDLLSRSECVELIRKLATCAFPFCCAHGRPSVVPLCVLGGTAPSSRAPRLGGGRGRGRWAAVGRSQR